MLTAELRSLGVPRWRLYSSDVVHLMHGVVATRSVNADAYEVRVAAARAILDEGRFFSRRTAAREIGVPLREQQAIEIGAVRPCKPPRRPGIVGHQLRTGVLRIPPTGPFWLPHPADVWGLLAPVCGVGELVAAGDFLISGKSRYESPLCVQDELVETVERFRGGTGVERLRAALPFLRTGVESPTESALRLLIVRAGLPEPVTCCPVATSDRTYHADLGYPELRIAIEYDGAYHFNDGVGRARRDNERVEAMIAAGWRVLRATLLDLQNPRAFLQRLLAAIEHRRQELRRF